VDKANPPNSLQIQSPKKRKSPIFVAFIAIIVGSTVTITTMYLTNNVFGGLMKGLQNTFFYYLIPFVISFSLLGILIWKTSVERIFGLNYLAAFVLSIGLSDLFRLLSGSDLSRTIPFQRDGIIFPTLVDLMLPIAVLFLFLHIELVNDERPKLTRSILIFGTALPLIIGGLFEILLVKIDFLQNIVTRETLKSEVEGVLLFFLLLFGLVILAISVDGIVIMYKTLTHAESREILFGSFLMMAGFASLITNFVLIGVRDSISIAATLSLVKLQELNVHTSYVVMSSLFLILIAYILIPKFAYSVPFDVYQIIVLDRETGTTLFSHVNTQKKNQPNLNAEISLKSPALVAIQTLLKEITFAEGTIEKITLSDRQLLFKSVENIAVVAISNHSSYFLKKGVKSFAQVFFTEFKEEILNFRGNVSIFQQKGEELLLKHLPFFVSDY